MLKIKADKTLKNNSKMFKNNYDMAGKKHLKSKLINLIVSLCLLIAVIVLVFITFFGIYAHSEIANYIVIAMIMLLIFLLIFSFIKNKDKIFKLSVCAATILSIIYLIYFILLKLNLLDKIASIEDIKKLIISTGAGGILTFFAITIIQVVFLPIPSSITIIAGTLIYGPTLTFIISTLGIVTGSFLAFLLGRFFGKKLIIWLFGQENVSKYIGILDKNGQILLFFMFLLPFFPDDLLCMLAGLTNMPCKNFVIITVISRSIGVAGLSYFGSGSIIPFKGWGIIAWIIIAVIVVVLIIIYLKYKEKILEFIQKKFKFKSYKFKN